MASKLDETIASVAVIVAGRDPSRMIAAAAVAAPKVSAADAATLPERWDPKITSKAAGAPNLRDSWGRLWFEALVEILCQKGADGLPALYELLERDVSTYHEIVGLRLLRLAASGLERKAIMAKLQARLLTLHRTQVLALVREVVFWSRHDGQPLELLRPLAKLKVKNAEGDTVGAYIEQCEADLALIRAQENPQQADDPVDEAVVRVAILRTDAAAFTTAAGEAARALGPAAVDTLPERLQRPPMAALQSRVLSTLRHDAVWIRAIMEILSHFGAAAIPAAQSFLKDKDAYVQETALRLCLLLAARTSGGDRERMSAELRKRLPKFHFSEVRSAIGGLSADAATDPEIADVLEALDDVVVKAYGSNTAPIRVIREEVFKPPTPKKKASAPRRMDVEPFARRFGAAIVAGDFASAHGMLSAAWQKKFTPKKLAGLVEKESRHSGPPEAFEFGDNDTTAAELRTGDGEFPALPAHVTDANFRRWCCLQFLPSEDSDADACFDLWMAVVEENAAPKVGFFHLLDAD